MKYETYVIRTRRYKPGKLCDRHETHIGKYHYYKGIIEILLSR